MSEIKSGAPDVGLFLTCRTEDTADLIAKLRQIFFVFNRSEYEKNMHVIEIVLSVYDEKNRAGAEILVELAKTNGVVGLIRDDYKLAQELDADGVILSDFEDIRPAREVVDEASIVALRCKGDHALALKSLDAGIDCVGFDENISRSLAEWTTKTDKPCLVEGHINNDNCGLYVQGGATFINATDYVFQHPKGEMQGVVNMLHAFEISMEIDVVN